MALTPQKSIGILGGMGPAASVDFLQRLVGIAQHTYGADQDTDYPVMYLYSLPLRDFDETGITNMESVRAQLERGARRVQDFGSDLMVIPCNTVHRLITEIRTAVSIPIISIIEAAAEAAATVGYKKVGLLTSETTRVYKLYEPELDKRNIAYLTVSDAEQRILNESIHHVMMGSASESDAVSLSSVISRMAADGAEAAILGCTELPLAMHGKNSPLPLITSTDELAKAALAAVYEK